MTTPTSPATTSAGRYNAISSAAFQTGAITGPIAAGLLRDRGWGEAHVALMVLGCVAVGALAMLLERRVPDTANGVPLQEPVVAA